MPIEWKHEEGNIVIFLVSGKLVKSELDVVQSEAEPLIQQGDAKLLVITEDFTGWEKEGNWADLSFGERNEGNIQKLAIVGDAKWRDLAYAFTLKGLRSFPIEYFETGHEDDARRWLASE